MTRTILVCEAQVPFVQGGAEFHVSELVRHLRDHGYETESIRLPFKWYPKSEILAHAAAWRLLDLSESNGRSIDLVIGTRFPTYFARHPRKVAWLIHQYRAAYELAGTPFSDFQHVESDVALRARLVSLDTQMLGECRRLFTNSANTAARVERFNGLSAEPLYHPPRLAARLRGGLAGGYLLSVGRLEHVKRVDLAIKAMAEAPAHLELLVAGTGTQQQALEELAFALGIGARVRFLGSVDDDRIIELYAGALGVIFAPYDEDYGYVTLEAFLSHKPVITAEDSGGPKEFVIDGVNGSVCPPDPERNRRSDRASRRRPPARRDDGGCRLRTGPRDYLDRRRRETGGRRMKKLIIQIPCLNEAATLPQTVTDLPREIAGIDVIEVLVIDDGSRDGTAEVARSLGVSQVVRFRRHKGLAAAFTAGIDACLKRGADIIVNTDADNQYAGRDIPRLIEPLLAGRADIVIGDRNIRDLAHMSWPKKLLQRLGSWTVRQVSTTNVPDTTSGFRAYTREAALRMTIVSEFSYTLESIIQAGKKRMAVVHVEVNTNPDTRESRLFSNMFSYIKQSSATIVRIYAMYEPLKVFTYIGTVLFLSGFLISLRFVFDYVMNGGFGHIQSLIFSAVLMIVGFQVVLIGLLADVMSGTRKLLEDLLYRVRAMELRQRNIPADGDGPES